MWQPGLLSIRLLHLYVLIYAHDMCESSVLYARFSFTHIMAAKQFCSYAPFLNLYARHVCKFNFQRTVFHYTDYGSKTVPLLRTFQPLAN
jgi:hypothetical protein